LIIVGDGTHLKRRPRHGTLDFYTKVQVWGRMVRVSPQVPYTPKAILVKRNKNDVNSALLKKESQKREIKKTIYDKKGRRKKCDKKGENKKRKKRREKV
jgi:hypothetical protein